MYNSIVMLSSGLSSAERTSTAGIVTLQGMLTIFAVLSILWGATEIMHRLMHRDQSEKKPQTDAPQANADAPTSPTPNAEDAAVAAAIAAALAAYEDAGATVAAITAAITAARAEEGNTGAFRVVSFKRVQASNRRRNF